MELRLSFDTIPEQFDKWRPRYCSEAFCDIIAYSQLGTSSAALEIGPGTGQATEPILKTGCNYTAIELGINLAKFMQQRFGHYDNFHIVNDDFTKHEFQDTSFDLIYSGATIQWIPEEIAFKKTHKLLKSGGTLAMMMTRSEYRSSNEELFQTIQGVYNRFFHPETPYSQKFDYTNATRYGFIDFECHEYGMQRVFTADEYVAFCGTHCDHIVLKDPERTLFYDGLHKAVKDAGDRIVFNDKVVLYLARKPF